MHVSIWQSKEPVGIILFHITKANHIIDHSQASSRCIRGMCRSIWIQTFAEPCAFCFPLKCSLIWLKEMHYKCLTVAMWQRKIIVENIFKYLWHVCECECVNVCVCQLAYTPKPCSMMWHCWLVLTLRLFRGVWKRKTCIRRKKEQPHLLCVCVCVGDWRQRTFSIYSIYMWMLDTFDPLDSDFVGTFLADQKHAWEMLGFLLAAWAQGINTNKQWCKHTDKDKA